MSLNIAICGGGIGGLTLAAALLDPAHSAPALRVDVYEAAPAFTELGAGVGVWLRTWRVLRALGLAPALDALAGRPLDESPRTAFEFRTGDRAPGAGFHTMVVPFGVLTLHRAAFQAALAARVPARAAHFRKRLVSYTAAAGAGAVTLHFADGSTATCDVLIGADGIHSAARGALLRARAVAAGAAGDAAAAILRAGEPAWSGTVVYRALIPRADLDAAFPGHRAALGPVVYFGKNQHVIAFPISHGAAVNLVAFLSSPAREGTPYAGAWVDRAPGAGAALRAAFAGWDAEVCALLALADAPSRWAIHTLPGLESYISPCGRVALLGDAAHAMTPHQGAGGGQAIEDAYVLAALLRHPATTRHTLPHALAAYDAVRVPGARDVAARSRLNGLLYEFNVPGFDAAARAGAADAETEDAALARLAARIMEIHAWEWAPEDPAADPAACALRIFAARLAADAP